MKIFWFLPNILTFTNLFFGCIGIVYGINGDLKTLSICVLFGCICDFFDGFFARLFNVDSSLGTQLDSFSDLVTFGLSSSVVMFNLMLNSDFVTTSNSESNFLNYLPFFSFLIVIASSYRLAKFNMQRKKNYFHGLPTPANAIFIVFLPYLFEHQLMESINHIINDTLFLIILVLISSMLLISNFEMPKFKGGKTSKTFNIRREFFILISIVLISFLKFAAFPIVILIYLVFGFLRIKF